MKFITKLWERIKALYLSLKPETKRAIHIAIEVTTRLNNFVNSTEADILTAIIPGNADDRVKEKLRIILPKLLQELGLANELLSDSNGVMFDGIKAISKLKDDAKSGFLHIIAVMIARKLNDIKWSDAVATIEYKYVNG